MDGMIIWILGTKMYIIERINDAYLSRSQSSQLEDRNRILSGILRTLKMRPSVYSIEINFIRFLNPLLQI